MNYFKLLLFSFFLCFFSQAFSQKTISGNVIDSLTSEPMVFVNIGIKNKNIGTTTNENGNFTLTIPERNYNDTLTFSIVGYQSLELPVKVFKTGKQVVRLLEFITQLSTIQVSAERLVERKFGIKRRNLAIHFSDGMFQENDVFEIGQLIKLKGSKAQITSVNLYLFDSERDSANFRINFYEVEEGVPSKRLINKRIVQQHPIEQGWVRLDISQENIVLKGNFVVTLEFLPEKNETNKKIFYEVKLGGSSRSYYRKNSLGSWNTPPHHYCMYVTALVDNSIPEEPEEIETLPTASMWSVNVEDSFKIFLRLPLDYERKKKRSYPIIYCLDANAYFDHICHIVDDLSKKNMLKVEPIILGIGYDNTYVMDSLRVRDYTFPKAPTSDSLLISGGGNKFYNFIKSELISYMKDNYRVDTTNSTIMGHSFGGYFVSFTLFNDLSLNNSMFNHYVAASPSLWYYNGYLIKQFDSLWHSKIAVDKSNLFITSGEEELILDYDQIFKLFSKTMFGFESIVVESKVYPNLDHMGAAIPAFEDAIKSIYGKK